MGNAITTKKLDEEQLEAFDTEYVTPELWEIVSKQIDATWPSGRFHFVDLGGGNGKFADALLARYPNATGVVLDNGRSLLDKNIPHPNKRLVFGSIEDLDGSLQNEKFDLVCYNWVLHHLIDDSHKLSTRNQVRALEQARGLLNPGGRVSVFENFYEGTLFNSLPGRLIFALTSSRMLAPLTKRFGANTAGVGVCFRSEASWKRAIAAAGLQATSTGQGRSWKMAKLKQIILHIGTVRCGHIWCA
jgi:SAM-dependent methyltransferase